MDNWQDSVSWVAIPYCLLVTVLGIPAVVVRLLDARNHRLGPWWAFIAGISLLGAGPILFGVALERSDPLDYQQGRSAELVLAGLLALAGGIALLGFSHWDKAGSRHGVGAKADPD